MTPRERLRAAVGRTGCTRVAPIYDALSARVAEVSGWEVCKMSGSVGKFASLAVPDDVILGNMSDLVDVVRRITRAAGIPLVVDADNLGGTALTVYRSVQDLEAAGVAGIEIEDSDTPTRFGQEEIRHMFLISQETQVNRLRAAVAARRDPALMLLGRTSATFVVPMEEAIRRIEAYATTGIDAIVIPGLSERGISPNPRRDIEAIQTVSDLPLFLAGLPDELASDADWLADNRVQLLYQPQLPYTMAVKAIHTALRCVRNDETPEPDSIADADLLAEVSRLAEYQELDERYGT